ncbi:hypothetical protein QTP88_008468 [Uroleucon formosanum]
MTVDLQDVRRYTEERSRANRFECAAVVNRFCGETRRIPAHDVNRTRRVNINYSICPKQVMCRMIEKFGYVSHLVAWFIRFTKNVELMCDYTALVDPSHREPNNHIIIETSLQNTVYLNKVIRQKN